MSAGNIPAHEHVRCFLLMDLLTLLTFMGISLGIISMPGPNVLVVVSTSISEGKTRASQTIAGIGVAMALQLFVAALSTAWLIAALTSGFELLKWAGVCYLVYLAFRQFIEASQKKTEVGKTTAIGSFTKGFVASLTNAKTILFFGAFLPQFVSPGSSYALQIFVLSATFWLLALLVNTSYMLLAHILNERLTRAHSSKTDERTKWVFISGRSGRVIHGETIICGPHSAGFVHAIVESSLRICFSVLRRDQCRQSGCFVQSVASRHTDEPNPCSCVPMRRFLRFF